MKWTPICSPCSKTGLDRRQFRIRNNMDITIPFSLCPPFLFIPALVIISLNPTVETTSTPIIQRTPSYRFPPPLPFLIQVLDTHTPYPNHHERKRPKSKKSIQSSSAPIHSPIHSKHPPPLPQSPTKHHQTSYNESEKNTERESAIHYLPTRTQNTNLKHAISSRSV